MQDDKMPPLPEGMQSYEVLGLHFVAPAGLPAEFITSIAEGMYMSGHVRFDAATETLVPVSPEEDGKIKGMVMKMNGLNVVGSTMIPDEEIKKTFGIKDLFVWKKKP